MPTRRGTRCVPPAPGQQAERDFGEAEARLRVVGGDAVVAGQRDLHAAAQGGAVDRRGDRLAAEFDAAHQLVPVR
jgi:hypothetical protein